MYSIGICDDGKYVCASIENMLFLYAKEKNIHIDVKIWYTEEGLKNYLEQGNYLDILYLDIELFKMTGIEVGNYIRNQLDDMRLQIIYISGKTSYAQQLFKTQPMDFLVKPISQKQIDETMEIAIKIIEKRNVRLEFQCGKDYYYIPIGDIIYLASEGRKVKIVTLKTKYVFYGKLKEVAGKLSEDFVIIHKSYIINKEYVFRYTYEEIELINGIVLTISKVHRKQVRERILREER